MDVWAVFTGTIGRVPGFRMVGKDAKGLVRILMPRLLRISEGILLGSEYIWLGCVVTTRLGFLVGKTHVEDVVRCVAEVVAGEDASL